MAKSNMSNGMYNDKYVDYYAVMEQTTPENVDMQILKCEDKDLHFIRFSCCLQSFYGRNRNGRLWTADQVKKMAGAAEVQELLQHGSFVGEAGHPLPTSDKEWSLKRICTIDPLRTSHRIISMTWRTPQLLYGIIETLDEGEGTPGRRFMKNIQQGIDPAMSLRSLVPQRKNNDGTIDVLAPGRMICYDRVYLPSHKEAYRDVDVPIKEIVSKSDFEVVMESFTEFVMSHSDKVRRVTDNMDIALEGTHYDPESQMVSVAVNGGPHLFVAPELKYRKEIKDLMTKF